MRRLFVNGSCADFESGLQGGIEGMFEPCSLWNAGARRAVSCPYMFIGVLVGILECTSHVHGHALS